MSRAPRSTPSAPVDAVGISNQRGSTIVWDRATGEPVGPGLGWQDLRTIGACLAYKGEGFRFAPNQAATKLQWLLDTFDADRTRDLCFGTVDTWITWVLSEGTAHVTDATNAAVTGIQVVDQPEQWNARVLDALAHSCADAAADRRLGWRRRRRARACRARRRSRACSATSRRRSSARGACTRATPRSPSAPAACSTSRSATRRPRSPSGGPQGTFPIVAWRRAGRVTWGIEAVMLAAGTNVQWLRDGLGLIASSDESHEIAASCPDSGGVVFVPAPLGLGTPAWDYGARGALFGLTRGSGRAEIVRAVLEGIAHRGADLVEAAEADAGITIPALRVDGGMTDNPTFLHALADSAQKPVEVSPVREATTLGAALMAGLAVGHHDAVDDLAGTWSPRVRVEPESTTNRDQWRDAVSRARRWIPDLSGIDF